MKRFLAILCLYGLVGCVEFHDANLEENCENPDVWEIVCIEENPPYNAFNLQYISYEKLPSTMEVKLCEENQ